MITVSPEPGKYDSVKLLKGGRVSTAGQITVRKKNQKYTYAASAYDSTQRFCLNNRAYS